MKVFADHIGNPKILSGFQNRIRLDDTEVESFSPVVDYLNIELDIATKSTTNIILIMIFDHLSADVRQKKIVNKISFHQNTRSVFLFAICCQKDLAKFTW